MKTFEKSLSKWDKGTFEKHVIATNVVGGFYNIREKKRSGMEKFKSMQISESRWYASVEINWWVY